MAMERFFGYTRRLSTGEPIGGATVTVYDVGTLNLSSIYTTSGGGTPKANPFQSDSTGYFYFYAAVGAYDVKFTAVGETEYTWGDVQLHSSFVLNSQPGATQTFATGTSGTDFAISSATNTHTFNLPSASASARGVVTTGTQTLAGNKTLTGTLDVSGQANFLLPPTFRPGGAASGSVLTSGRIASYLTPAGSVGTGETVLQTHNLPANALDVNGKGVFVTAWGTLAANGNTKTLKVYVGAWTAVSLVAVYNNVHWLALVQAYRKGSSTLDLFSLFYTSSVTYSPPFLGSCDITESTGSAITIKVTGQGTTGNDVVCRGMVLETIG